KDFRALGSEAELSRPVHIKPKWGDFSLEKLASAPLKIERWLESLDMAPKSRGHLKALLHRLYECAMKWSLYPVGRNPMELVEVKNVTKRLKQPLGDVLYFDQFHGIDRKSTRLNSSHV